MDSVHNAEFYPVSLDELGGWLQFQMFQPVDLTFRNRPIKEWVFERPYLKDHVIRVYTGIDRYGRNRNQSRKVGKDAIRVQAVYRPTNGPETLVNNQKRVHRVKGWKDNLKSRIIEILRNKPQVVLDSRGIPMVLRTNRYDGSKFWGSRDYPRNRETKPFAADWSGMNVLGGLDEIPDMLKGRREEKHAEDNEIRKLLHILQDRDWDDIEWITDEPPNKSGPEDWGTDVDWEAEEIELKQFDDTVGRKYKDMDEKIADMIKSKSKINQYGEMGCPACESVDLFEAKITEKGKAFNCWWCGFERKIETIKSRGDITLEKFGMVVECPHCEQDIKAYNNASFNRHLKKCRESK